VEEEEKSDFLQQISADENIQRIQRVENQVFLMSDLMRAIENGDVPILQK
jgi:hypothetical protein